MQAWAAVAVAVAVLLLLTAVFIGAGVGLMGQQDACGAPAPTGPAAATIPARYLALYHQAGAQTGVPWPVLAGVGEVESDHGRSNAPGVRSGANLAGAAGPMQIGVGGAAGDTWGGVPVHPASEKTGGIGIDGDHDGQVNVYDPADAIPAAAVYLKANGAPGDIPGALFAYNHDEQYVTTVLSWASRYTAGGAADLTAASDPGCVQAAVGPLPAGVAGKVISFAEQQLGKPYVWGGTGPAAFDCSGLTMMAYRASGIAIPRTSEQQWDFGRRVPAGQEQPGDLVFFAGSDGTMTTPGHVGIVVGKGMMIDAPQAGETVHEEPYTNSPDLVGFTRPTSAA